MNIVIEPLTQSNVTAAMRVDGSFVVEQELAISWVDRRLHCEAVPVPAYEKRYPPAGEDDVSHYMNEFHKAGFVAYADGTAAGRLLLGDNWNGYAIIDDIAVDRPCRWLGIGKALVHRAIAWAKHRRLPGLMLETQTNNVPACALYERCGFTLGGFDEWLYRALHPKTTEAALFWYLPLRNAGA